MWDVCEHTGTQHASGPLQAWCRIIWCIFKVIICSLSVLDAWRIVLEGCVKCNDRYWEISSAIFLLNTLTSRWCQRTACQAFRRDVVEFRLQILRRTQPIQGSSRQHVINVGSSTNLWCFGSFCTTDSFYNKNFKKLGSVCGSVWSFQ